MSDNLQVNPSPSATSKAKSASKIAKKEGDMVYWTFQRDVTVYLSGISVFEEEKDDSEVTVDLPDLIVTRSKDILKMSIPPDLIEEGKDANLAINYGLLFERPRYNKATVETLLQEIQIAQRLGAVVSPDYSDGTPSSVDKQGVADAINMSIMFRSRLTFDEKRAVKWRRTVHQTYESTCRIPVDFFVESTWARGEDDQIVAHEPTWKLPKPKHPERIRTSLEPNVVRPDAIFAVQVRTDFMSSNIRLLACLNLVDHLPPPQWIWDTLDLAFLIVEYKRSHLQETAALSQLVMAMTSALCHLAHFGVTGLENPIYGLCICRQIARIVVGWQVNGKTVISDIPEQLGKPGRSPSDGLTFDLSSPFACLRLGTTIKSLQQYSKDLKMKVQRNWDWMQSTNNVPVTGWCTRV